MWEVHICQWAFILHLECCHFRLSQGLVINLTFAYQIDGIVTTIRDVATPCPANETCDVEWLPWLFGSTNDSFLGYEDFETTTLLEATWETSQCEERVASMAIRVPLINSILVIFAACFVYYEMWLCSSIVMLMQSLWSINFVWKYMLFYKLSKHFGWVNHTEYPAWALQLPTKRALMYPQS